MAVKCPGQCPDRLSMMSPSYSVQHLALALALPHRSLHVYELVSSWYTASRMLYVLSKGKSAWMMTSRQACAQDMTTVHTHTLKAREWKWSGSGSGIGLGGEIAEWICLWGLPNWTKLRSISHRLCARWSTANTNSKEKQVEIHNVCSEAACPTSSYLWMMRFENYNWVKWWWTYYVEAAYLKAFPSTSLIDPEILSSTYIISSIPKQIS